MYADGGSFAITGGMSQTKDLTKAATASYNQLIYENVTALNQNKDATVKYLFGGAGQVGKTKGNRIYVSDLNKDIADNITIQTILVGGGTWRPKSGGAEENIAVVTGGSKIANIYGGAVGLDGTAGTDESDGANWNLVILDLSDDGIVTENVYGGYISDGTRKTSAGDTIPATDATSQNNAVYVLGGEVAGSIVGGNKENTGNTLILGKDKDHLGIITAGQISNFSTLQFNAINDTDAVLTLTDSANGADLDGVEIKFLDKGISDGAVEVVVGGNGGIGVNEKRDSGGGANAITGLTKNTIKYSANLDEISVVASGAEAKNDIVEELKRTDGSEQASYGIGDTFNYTYETIDLTKPNKKILSNQI